MLNIVTRQSLGSPFSALPMLRRGFTRHGCMCTVTVGAGRRKGAWCRGTDMITALQFQWDQTSFDPKFGQRYVGWSLPSFLSMTTIISNKEKWQNLVLSVSHRADICLDCCLSILCRLVHICVIRLKEARIVFVAKSWLWWLCKWFAKMCNIWNYKMTISRLTYQLQEKDVWPWDVSI